MLAGVEIGTCLSPFACWAAARPHGRLTLLGNSAKRLERHTITEFIFVTPSNNEALVQLGRSDLLKGAPPSLSLLDSAASLRLRGAPIFQKASQQASIQISEIFTDQIYRSPLCRCRW